MLELSTIVGKRFTIEVGDRFNFTDGLQSFFPFGLILDSASDDIVGAADGSLRVIYRSDALYDFSQLGGENPARFMPRFTYGTVANDHIRLSPTDVARVIYPGSGADTITGLGSGRDLILVTSSLNSSGRVIFNDVPASGESWDGFQFGADRILVIVHKVVPGTVFSSGNSIGINFSRNGNDVTITDASGRHIELINSSNTSGTTSREIENGFVRCLTPNLI